MRAPGGLHLDYLSLAEYQSASHRDVLGVATFNGAAQALTSAELDIPVAEVSTPVLSASSHVYEVWRCGGEAQSGQHEHVRYRRAGDMLFGCIAVSEEMLRAGAGATDSALHLATSHAYRQICATLDREEYPHLLRIWNYLPAINRDSGGLERYRQFNSARQDALRASGRALTGQVPAASALGAPLDSPLLVYFLAGRSAPSFVENPRQVSAYHYPQQYGTHSPVFSRATVLRQSDSLMLFISGTASIVGHRSLHPGDTAAQTRETLQNIAALVAEANRVAPDARFTLGSLACKVYVRHPDDLAVIQRELRSVLGESARAIYLQADICRQDLLVEIEAAGMSPLESG
jgi:enamine deaminase RidA (YjgF/YER057c/UK114 family)